LWRRKDGLALTLVTASLACALVAMLAPALPSVESCLLARQHGRAGFMGHVALLPYASMYTLDHEVCLGIPAHSMREVPEEDVVACERLAYEPHAHVQLTCEALHSLRQVNHFPTFGVMHLAPRLEACGGDWMDLLIISRGWRTTTRQHLRLFLDDNGGRWEIIE
jgi:hypothetical protein